MLQSSTIAQIEQIARDRVSGAAELGRQAAELLSRVSHGELREAADAVMRAQPAMAAVYNAAQAALTGRLDEFLERLQRSGDLISRKAAAQIRGKLVLTHSYSSTVIRALQAGAPARVVCTESLPVGEGRTAATVLHADVIPDAAIYSALAAVDIVLVGADAVTRDTVVNKIGTALVALAARERGKPAWVLCGSEKIVLSDWTPQLGDLFEAAPRAWFTGVIDDS